MHEINVDEILKSNFHPEYKKAFYQGNTVNIKGPSNWNRVIVFEPKRMVPDNLYHVRMIHKPEVIAAVTTTMGDVAGYMREYDPNTAATLDSKGNLRTGVYIWKWSLLDCQWSMWSIDAYGSWLMDRGEPWAQWQSTADVFYRCINCHTWTRRWFEVPCTVSPGNCDLLPVHHSVWKLIGSPPFCNPRHV